MHVGVDGDVMGPSITALKLYRQGYIEGLFIVKDIDNQSWSVIFWDRSEPSVTLRGMEAAEMSEEVRKEIESVISRAS